MTSSHFLFLPVPALAYTGFWVHFKRASLEETRHSESLIATCSKIIWTIDMYLYIHISHTYFYISCNLLFLSELLCIQF